MRGFYYGISQVESIFRIYYTIKQPLKFPRNWTAFNYLDASDKVIKLSLFPILMRAFWNWPNEFHSISGSKTIVSPCFHAVSFVYKELWNKQNQFTYPERPFLYF